jgi:hypothetical protein
MLQTPPPPLSVPAPVSTSSMPMEKKNINHEDLYDPLKAEDEDEEESEQKHSPIQKPANRTFNIKKEYTIKIEPSNNFH